LNIPRVYIKRGADEVDAEKYQAERGEKTVRKLTEGGSVQIWKANPGTRAAPSVTVSLQKGSGLSFGVSLRAKGLRKASLTEYR